MPSKAGMLSVRLSAEQWRDLLEIKHAQETAEGQTLTTTKVIYRVLHREAERVRQAAASQATRRARRNGTPPAQESGRAHSHPAADDGSEGQESGPQG